MEFFSPVTSLNAVKVDAIISSISNNYQRAHDISFSDLYYTSTFAIITAENNKAKTLDDFPKDAKIGVQNGSTMKNIINSYNRFSNKSLKIVSLSSNLILIEKLKLAEIDGLIIENAQAHGFMKNIPELKSQSVKDDLYIDEEENRYVVGFKKDSTLTDEINKGIESLNASAQIEALLKKWNLK